MLFHIWTLTWLAEVLLLGEKLMKETILCVHKHKKIVKIMSCVVCLIHYQTTLHGCVHGFNVIVIKTLVCTSWCSPGGCTTPFNPDWRKMIFGQCRKAKFHRKLVDDYITPSHLQPFEKSFESDQAPWNSDLPSHRDESTWGVSTGGEGQMEAKIETKGA